jgi:hypothetical protein
MNYFMSFIGTLTLVILPHTHSCQNHSCQTHSCHSIHSHLILIFTHLKLTITYSHCFFNLKITFIYSTLSPLYTHLSHYAFKKCNNTHIYKYYFRYFCKKFYSVNLYFILFNVLVILS